MNRKLASANESIIRLITINLAPESTIGQNKFMRHVEIMSDTTYINKSKRKVGYSALKLSLLDVKSTIKVLPVCSYSLELVHSLSRIQRKQTYKSKV